MMELISSDETASKISDVCLKNGIKDEKTVEGISYHIISVLLGRLRQELLSKALVTNLKIDALAAKRISEEANRLIFSQIPTSTAPLPEEKPEEKTILPIKEKPIKEEPPKEALPPRPSSSKDTYREQIK